MGKRRPDKRDKRNADRRATYATANKTPTGSLSEERVPMLGHENYEITKAGAVFSLRKNAFVKWSLTLGGMKCIRLSVGGRRYASLLPYELKAIAEKSWAAVPQQKPTLRKVLVPAIEFVVYAGTDDEVREAVLSGIKLQIENGAIRLDVRKITSEADIPDGWSTEIPFSPNAGPAANACQCSVDDLLHGRCLMKRMLGSCKCG